ncbi:MAG: hypothetical protein R3C03_10360 [Pirellulaceae bacterium]
MFLHPKPSNGLGSRPSWWGNAPVFGLGFFFFLLVSLSVGSAFGQFKYNPDDEEVERMVKRGLSYLGANPQTNHGEATLAALTVIEASKRYQREVPVSHPLVLHAISKVMDDLEEMGESVTSTSNELAAAGIYYPALAIIVMAEVDAQGYTPQINRLIQIIFEKRTQTGAFSYSSRSNSDSSQSQYAALAFAVLKLKGFPVYTNEAKGVLEFYCNYQTREGSWYYHTTPQGFAAGVENDLTLSRHMAGAGTVYLLQDLLNLTPKREQGGKGGMMGLEGELPPSVSIYIEPKDDEAEVAPDAPLVSFDPSKLSSVKAFANRWFKDNFHIEIEKWNYYYLYGLERYAYFRSRAEGQMRDVPNWYDQGVEFLMAKQQGDGSWVGDDRLLEGPNNSTCRSILFLVRASEILMLDSLKGQISGNKGFKENTRLDNQGGTTTQAAVEGVQDVMNALANAKSEDDIEIMLPAISQAISAFTSDPTKSRVEQKQFLQGLVTDEEWFRRKVAVRFLAASQDLDNVPALLYALSDPVQSIRIEAHNGLRLISRKIDAFKISRDPTLAECLLLKQKWTEWYKDLRPDAELFDE